MHRFNTYSTEGQESIRQLKYAAKVKEFTEEVDLPTCPTPIFIWEDASCSTIDVVIKVPVKEEVNGVFELVCDTRPSDHEDARNGLACDLATYGVFDAVPALSVYRNCEAIINENTLACSALPEHLDLGHQVSIETLVVAAWCSNKNPGGVKHEHVNHSVKLNIRHDFLTIANRHGARTPMTPRATIEYNNLNLHCMKYPKKLVKVPFDLSFKLSAAELNDPILGDVMDASLVHSRRPYDDVRQKLFVKYPKGKGYRRNIAPDDIKMCMNSHNVAQMLRTPLKKMSNARKNEAWIASYILRKLFDREKQIIQAEKVKMGVPTQEADEEDSDGEEESNEEEDSDGEEESNEEEESDGEEDLEFRSAKENTASRKRWTRATKRLMEKGRNQGSKPKKGKASKQK